MWEEKKYLSQVHVLFCDYEIQDILFSCRLITISFLIYSLHELVQWVITEHVLYARSCGGPGV